MTSGQITLFDPTDEVIHSTRYRDRWHRKIIVSGWWAIYGQGMERCNIQYCPDTDDQRIDETGGNIRRLLKSGN